MKMKTRTRILQYLFLLMGAMVSFSSCSKDDDVEAPTPEPEPAKPTTYTVMLYGCGGGNLDDCLEFNLTQLEAYGKPERVNFTGLVKFSKPFQDVAEKQGTRLITLVSNQKNLTNEKVYDAYYRMDDPANLAKFIKESKERMPADKYILIFWNHGAEFGLSDRAYSDKKQNNTDQGARSILFDDNTDNSLSLYDIENGIKESGTKMDLVYMDLCNYGMAEVNYQLKDCTKYLMAASAPTPGMGGNYTELLDDLQKNDSLEDAIKEYVPNCVKSWKTSNGNNAQQDLECYDLSYMDEFASNLKGAIDAYKKVINTDEQKEKFEESGGVVLDDYYGYFAGLSKALHLFAGYDYSADICSTFTRMASFTLDGNMFNSATLLEKSLEKMTVAQASNNLPSWMNRVSMGMLWPTNTIIVNIDKAEFKYNLQKAALYQYTGWGDFLLNTTFYYTKLIQSPFDEKEQLCVNGIYNYDYKYKWRFELVVDDSGLSEEVRSEVSQILNDVNSQLNSDEIDKFALSLGKYAMNQALESLDRYNEEEDAFMNKLQALGIEKFKIKLYTEDEIQAEDPNKEKFSNSLEEDVNIKEHINKKQG